MTHDDADRPDDGPTPDELVAIVRSHVARLAEHFDTCQVFVTRHASDEAGTHTFQLGGGNWCARFGQVREWVVKEEARFALDARAAGADDDD
jgi:hypothetical protein